MPLKYIIVSLLLPLAILPKGSSYILSDWLSFPHRTPLSFSPSSELGLNSEVEDDAVEEWDTELSEGSRESKLFRLALFPFFTFTSSVTETSCMTSKGVNGTCYTSSTCSSKGGTAHGSCSNGNGVCCLLERRCGSVIKSNNTYLTNDEYPNAKDGIGNCQYIIEKMNSNICQLRLDFNTLELEGPNLNSVCDTDTFTVVGTAGGSPIVLCGYNSGQHLYLDLASGVATARINVATTTSGVNRQWKIRVSQIPCGSIYRAPANCLQYHTGYFGAIKSFNYQGANGQQIANQAYSICIKTREGFCGVTYTGTDFVMTSNGTTGAAEEALGDDTNCSTDFLSMIILGKNSQIGADRFCGNAFNTTTTYSKPFVIRVFTDSTEDTTSEIDNIGFHLDYMQIPC